MEICIDCDGSTAIGVRCPGCSAEVAETPSWLPTLYQLEPLARPRPCERCGAAITSKRLVARFCSLSCSGRRQSPAICTEPGCQKPHRARGLCSTHYNNAHVPDRHRRWPGDPELRRRSLRRKTQARRAATRGVEVERVDRDVVGERDGWRCGICRRQVKKRLAWPHPKSPSLDHVIPLSEHGPHTYANCRIAHLDCNTKRSNRGGNEQLALIG